MSAAARQAILLLLVLATLGLHDLAAAAPAVAGAGNTYYVRTGGDDGADGRTLPTAWRSVGRVDQAQLQGGDQVLFEGGSTFTGQLYLSPAESGTPGAPIALASYGNQPATIDGGAGGAFLAYDTAGIAISNLNFLGAGAGVNGADGVSFYNDLGGGVKLAYLRISNVDVSGFGRSGIAIGGYNGASGFTDVQVTSSTLHGNRDNGLISYGPALQPASPSYANSNFYIAHVSAYDNRGDPGNRLTNSGNGIVLGSVRAAMVERSSAWGNGLSCSAPECGAGIWTYDSTAVTIQYCESYANRAASGRDGDGFDLDQNVSNSYLQYDYSHGNDGAGFLDFSRLLNSIHANNTVRYNVSENDARTGGGAIALGGVDIGDVLYDNTVFVAAPGGVVATAVGISGAPSGVTLRNNIFYTTGGLPTIMASALTTAGVLFQQNDYAPSFAAVWGSSVYTQLDRWREGTGQERIGGRDSGLALNPALASPGNGGTIGSPDRLATLSAYRLLPGSPIVNAGLNLQSRFGIDMGGHDFYGVPVPSGSAPDIGASERT